MSGHQPKPRKERTMATALRQSGQLARDGMEFLQCWPQDIGPIIAANPGYRTFSIIRDPYQRIYSAYFNKLNHYTKRFRTDLYLKGQLTRLFAGPRGWKRVAVGNLAVHPHLPFQTFLHELVRHGVHIDPHFDLQTSLLNLPAQRYDRLLDIKDLKSGLKPLLADLGTPANLIARVPDIPHANQRATVKDATWLTSEVARMIEQLYEADFRLLDMPKRSD